MMMLKITIRPVGHAMDGFAIILASSSAILALETDLSLTCITPSLVTMVPNSRAAFGLVESAPRFEGEEDSGSSCK